jgi:hypothetical protein
MGKFNTVWLRSVMALLFVCSITLVHATTFAAESTGMADGVSFEVLNPETEMIMPSWAPYHTVHGYRAEDSCVTVSGIGLGGDFTDYGGGTGAAWTVDFKRPL